MWHIPGLPCMICKLTLAMILYKARPDPRYRSTVPTLGISIENRAMMTNVANLHDAPFQDCFEGNCLGHLFIHGRVSSCEYASSEI